MNNYSDGNPNPVITLDSSGSMVYENIAAQRIFSVLRGDLDGIVYPTGFTQRAAESLESKTAQKQAFRISIWHFSFSFHPRENENLIDVFGMDISEEVKQQSYFSLISSFSNALLKAETEMEIGQTIMREALNGLSLSVCAVYLIDERNGRLQKCTVSPDDTEHPDSNFLREEISLAAAIEKKTVITNNVYQETGYADASRNKITPVNRQRGSKIAVPILADEEVIGVIRSEYPEKYTCTKDDVKIFEAIASMSAARIKNLRNLKHYKLTQTKYQTFVENAFGGLYIQRNRRFEYANDQFCQITGYTEAELLDSSFNIGSLIIDADQRAIRAMQSRNRGDHSPKSYQLEIITKQRSIRKVAINTCIIEDDQDLVTIGIALDVTDTVQSQYQLQEVIEKLEKKSDELNEFAHLASHNLRAPVTNLIGLLEHYNKDNPADSDNQIIVDKLVKTVGQLNSTLEEMHQVLRVRAKDSSEFDSVNLNEILQNVKNQLSETIQSCQFNIETNFEIENVNYDRSHLENLFLNMVSNAIKYRKEEGCSMLEIHSYKSNDHVKVVFKDNGLGIDLDKYGKDLFGMYKRFHVNFEGRGVGLYLVKKQLNALGSRISVESKPNQGARFTVDLVNRK